MPQLFKNKDFVLTMIAFSIYMGIFKGFAVVTPYLLGPFGFNSSEIANFGTLTLIGGVLSSMGISSVVKRVRRYKITIILLMMISVLICGFFYPALMTGVSYLSYIVGFFAGFALVPLGPVMMELCCEIIYPLNGSFAVGILYSGATLFSVVGTQVLTFVTKGTDSDKFSSFIGVMLIVGSQIAGAIMFLFVKEF